MVDAAHDAIQAQKTAIRRIALARRDAMPQELRAAKSDRIATVALDYLDERLAHPDGDGEQDTVRTSQTHPSQRPVATMRFLEVPAHRLDEAASLFAAKPIRSHSTDEPWMATFPAVPVPDIDAFVVPLVAYDDDGNRLGYGGGNYDRALPLASPDATVVGVAFAEQRVTSVPTSAYDVRIPDSRHISLNRLSQRLQRPCPRSSWIPPKPQRISLYITRSSTVSRLRYRADRVVVQSEQPATANRTSTLPHVPFQRRVLIHNCPKHQKCINKQPRARQHTPDDNSPGEH